jgi:hypothetical protein
MGSAINDPAKRASPSDPKRPKRIRNPKVLKAFHEQENTCLSCGNRHVEAHHLLPRSRGGDDTLPNLIGLCSICHGVLHDDHPRRGDFGHVFTSEGVKASILSWLRSEAGDDARWYLTKKLGLEGSKAWVERTFGEWE